MLLVLHTAVHVSETEMIVCFSNSENKNKNFAFLFVLSIHDAAIILLRLCIC